MNAEQLEALAGGANPSTLGMDFEEAIKILACRVIAAEKLAEAGAALFEQAAHVHQGGLIPQMSIHTAAQNLGPFLEEYQKTHAAYREASK